MKISGVSSYKVLKRGEISDKTAIVVNLLRTNAVITAALASGVDRVIPAGSVEEAIEARRQFPDAILGGQMDGLPIAGFEKGNSPGEYTGRDILSRVMILCTTNGTQAIKSAFEARTVLLGSIVNARAVANAAFSLGDDIMLICAGTKGRLSLLDLYAAGGILSRMCELDPSLEATLDDTCLLALRLYNANREAPEAVFSGVYDYERLTQQGYAADILDCLREDCYAIAPVYYEGIITNENK